MASNEVRAHRQRFFYCELVASIYLSPLQSRSCNKAKCLKIPHEGLCAPYGFVLVCSDKVCVHTVSLAQGSFISWINDSFSGIFTTRLSDNRSLVKGALHSGDWQRTFQKEVTQEMLGPASDERGPPYASLLMNSATQCLRPEWQHGTGRWVGSGDSEGVRCHLLWCWALHYSLHKCNRTEKRTTMNNPFGGGCGLRMVTKLHNNHKGARTSENFHNKLQLSLLLHLFLQRIDMSCGHPVICNNYRDRL